MKKNRILISKPAGISALRRNPAIAAALFVFLGLLSGCRSFPAPKSADDTLLVVPYLLFM